MSLNSINKYLPYMKYYDDVENVWSPYIVLKQQQNINNEVLNTDQFGFRYTDSDEKYTILNDKHTRENKEQIIITGNSTALVLVPPLIKKQFHLTYQILLKKRFTTFL